MTLFATTLRVTHESRCPEIGPICAERNEPPQVHDQRFYLLELRPVLEYAITTWLGAEAQLPLRLNDTGIIYRRMDGSAFVPEYADIHHRNETLTGLVDPWLSARFHVEIGGFRFSGRTGVTLPLGRVEENPFIRGEQGLEHQHVQFGTGTFTPLLGLDAVKAVEDVTFRGWSLARLSLYDNRHGFRASHQLSGGLSAGLKVFDRLELALTFDALHETPERWDGVIRQDGNLGRTDLLAGVFAAISLPAELALTASIKAPVYQHFETAGDDHASLTYPAVVDVGIRRTFDVGP